MLKPLSSFPISPDSVSFEEVLRAYQKRCEEKQRRVLSREKKIVFALLFFAGLLLGTELLASWILTSFFSEDPFSETIQKQKFPPNFPSQKPETQKILVLGDSLTLGLGISMETTYPNLLGAKLPQMEIFNAGIPGATLKHWNDFSSLISSVQPKLLLVCLGWEDLIQISLQNDFSQMPLHSVFYHSSLVRLLLTFKRNRAESSAIGRKNAWIQFQERSVVPYHYPLIFQPISIHLKNLIDFSKEKNISLVLIELPHFFQQIPDPEDPENLKISRLARRSIWSLKNWQEMIRQFNETLRSVGKQEGVPVLQFSSETFSSKHFRDFRHLTEEGHQKMTQTLFQQFQPQEFFLPKKKE